MEKRILLLCMFLGFHLIGFSQKVSIVNNKFVVNGNASCPIYFNGANTPWESWNDFGGSYNQTKWAQDMVDLKNKGINAARIWFSCNGSGQPSIASDGTVSAPTAAFWTNCDHLFAQAQANGVYIQATMMSFDHTKTGNPNANNWRAMMNDPNKIKTYVDNYLVPFVNRYKTNPYLWSIDICNEIEWIHENSDNWQCSYAVLQQFVGLCAAGMHQSGVARTDGSKVLVSLGSACVKWNGSKLPSGGTNPDGNKWSDANLKAQTSNNTSAYLDFYSPHFYGWMEQYYSSPFEKTPAQFGMDDKPCVVAEMPARDPMPTPAMSLTTAFNNLKSGGWQGHMPWTANITSNLSDEVGSLADFGAAAQTFTTNNSALVKPTCAVACATVAPIVTTPVTYCLNATSIALTATGTTLKWYADNTTTTAMTGAPTPSTSAIGTKNYYVSQTLNSCEGPRAVIAVTVNALPTAAITTTTSTTFCAGGSVTLTSNGGTAYQWNNAAGVITGATNATYLATTAGSYTVKVTNANNCSSTSAATAVTVNALPVAAITTTTSTTFCAGGSVTLTSNGGTAYQWNNAAGVITGATNATYLATTTGSYTVKVTNANNCSATSAATAVTVNALPVAAITTTTSTTFCAGGSVTLTSNGGTAYQWNNAAGVITGATNATYLATTTGSYTVKVTNANNCSATSAATAVTVNALPTAAITTTTSTTFCQGGSVTLTSIGGTAYQWNNAAGVITGATNATYLATTAGLYTVKVTNANNCSATSAATAVTVNALPVAAITTTTSTTFCAGGSVTLTSNGGTAYQWNNTAGVISGATNATYSAIASGSYTVKVTNANNCSATSTATVVTVNALPTAAITTTTSTTFCQGGSVTLTSNGGTAYQWNNAAGVITGATNATYSAIASGSYTVKVTNANNCLATSPATVVTVNALPTAAITTTTSTTFCQGGSVTLTSNGGTAYQWNNIAGVITGATNATYSAITSGSYTVKVTNANNCSATSTATAVTVNALPTAAITTTTSTTFCTGGSVTLTSSTGTAYQWNNAAGVIIGATNATYLATTAGSYTVKVTNANNCSVTSTATAVTVNALPTAAITTTTSTTFCQGGSVTLTSNGGTAYQWSNTAGVISGATNATYLATTAGSYTVKVTNANNCSATSIATAVSVTSSITWYQDLDGDGKGNAAVTQTSCTQPTGYVSVAGDACPTDANKIAAGSCGCGNLETDTDEDLTADCIDTDDDNDGIADVNDCAPLNASIGAAAVWYQDLDGDGKGNAAVTQTSCTQPTGYVSLAGDACPTDANKIAAGSCGCGNLETDTDEDLTADCIDTDDDNDGIADVNDCAPLNASIGAAAVWYQDLDGDGIGNTAVNQTSCSQPTGYVSESGDGCPTDANKIAAGSCGCGIVEGTCQTTGVVDLKSMDAIKIMPNPSSEQFNLILVETANVHIYTVEGKLVDEFTNVSDIKFGTAYAKGVYVVQIMNGSNTQVIRVIKQ